MATHPPREDVSGLTGSLDASTLERITSNELVDGIRGPLPVDEQTDHHLLGETRDTQLPKPEGPIVTCPAAARPLSHHGVRRVPHPLGKAGAPELPAQGANLGIDGVARAFARHQLGAELNELSKRHYLPSFEHQGR